MSTTQLPPEITEKYPITDTSSNADKETLQMFREIAMFGYNLGSQKQWIDVNEDTKLPNRFIACEKGTNRVGEAEFFRGQIFWTADVCDVRPITISAYQPLPAPPQTNNQ